MSPSGRRARLSRHRLRGLSPLRDPDITQNNATGSLMRTAPLWGLRKITRYLHDGRAATLDQAILAHDGQAKKARDRFASLPGWKKNLLYAFLNSLQELALSPRPGGERAFLALAADPAGPIGIVLAQ